MDAERNADSMPVLRMTVNGIEREVAASPTERLTGVLRDHLGLTGTKVGCDAGDCGACTVLIDGRQACACLTAAGQAEGRSITTVEGLAVDGVPGALQQSFIAHGAAQCGICTPGMLMASADLLARNPRPDAQAVEDALGGVLCRCTGYRNIIDAVLACAAGALPDVSPRADAPLVGQRVARVDAVPKVTGREVFGADHAPAGSLWLRAVRSPHARARFTLGDLAAFKARHPGLVDVITAADVPVNSFGIFPDYKDQPVLAEGVVRHRGEAVVALVGSRDAVFAIDDADVPIAWAPLPALLDIDAALSAPGRGDAPLHATRADNVLVRGRVVRGDVDGALATAAHVARGVFETTAVEHAYIEPEAGYAERVTEGGVDRVRVFGSTQTPYMDRDEIARILALRETQVHIVPSAVGGGFGGKLDIAVQPLVAVAAWKLHRPVRAVFTREESMVATTKRHPARMEVAFACDAEGMLLACDFVGDFDTGAYASWGSTVANRVPIHASGPYCVPNVRALTRAVYTNGPIAGAFRGFGVPQSTIAHEALLDDLAARCGLDPLEFRHRNALRAGQVTATGQRLEASCGLAACLAALRPHWATARARCETHNAGQPDLSSLRGTRRGVGIACMWYGIGNTVIANPSTLRASLRRDGRIRFYNGAVDIGQGSNTTLMQVLADALGLPMACIDYVLGDTALTADAGKTSASRPAFVAGNAAARAGADLRRRMLALAEVGADAVLSLEGATLVARAGGRESRIDLSELPADRTGDLFVGEGSFNPPTVPLDADGQGVPYATYAFAAQMAEVEVDVALGTTKVLSIVAAHDVGRALNPTQVEGQIHGGIAQGLGLALMEDYMAGLTDNLHDYLIPTVGDVPPITVILIEDHEPLGPQGAKGVGEPALIPTAPAIFGAIRHATGVRVRLAPATPARLRAWLVAQSRQPAG